MPHQPHFNLQQKTAKELIDIIHGHPSSDDLLNTKTYKGVSKAKLIEIIEDFDQKQIEAEEEAQLQAEAREAAQEAAAKAEDRQDDEEERESLINEIELLSQELQIPVPFTEVPTEDLIQLLDGLSFQWQQLADNFKVDKTVEPAPSTTSQPTMKQIRAKIRKAQENNIASIIIEGFVVDLTGRTREDIYEQVRKLLGL